MLNTVILLPLNDKQILEQSSVRVQCSNRNPFWGDVISIVAYLQWSSRRLKSLRHILSLRDQIVSISCVLNYSRGQRQRTDWLQRCLLAQSHRKHCDIAVKPCNLCSGRSMANLRYTVLHMSIVFVLCQR